MKDIWNTGYTETKVSIERTPVSLVKNTIQVVIPTSSYGESNMGVNRVLHFLYLMKLGSFLKMTKEKNKILSGYKFSKDWGPNFMGDNPI